jgi:hypothetical protein
MRTELDLPSRLAALRDDITECERGDFTDAQTGVDGQDERLSCRELLMPPTRTG